MFTTYSVVAILCAVFVKSSTAGRIMFAKCGANGFTCETSKAFPNKVDVIFQCNTTVTGQDVLLYLWQFNSPATITSFTIKDCETLRLSFACTGENKPIQWLKIRNISFLEIVSSPLIHNPPQIYFENVSYIENIPRHTFSQIKYQNYKPGCFNPLADLDGIFFTNVTIGNIETEAFRNLTLMKNVSWINVSVDRISTNAIKLSFEEGGCGTLRGCNLGILEPMAFQITGDKFSISRGKFGDIWGSGLNGTIYDFEFNNNSVANIQSGGLSILAQNVYIIDNHFQNIESGAFQKISPGLLHDSRRNFGKLIFVYTFSNNLIESVDDGGIRPDIVAYKNVAAEVTYAYNTMQCSCEGITWLGADVDLGYGYSVLKDFNTMILDPQNSNMCTFTPCMCFGVRSPNKKNSATATIF